MVGNLVAHDLHDVVAVCDETNRNGGREDGKLPDRDGSVLGRGLAVHPGVVNHRPRSDRVTNIVGAVSKRCSASSENLDKRVDVLDLVGVLLRVGIDTLHANTFGSSVDTGLSGVDVVVETVEKTDGDHGGDTFEESHNVLALVNFTSADGVVVKESHGPADRSALLPELRVEPGLALGNQFLVGELLDLGMSGSLLRVNRCNGVFRCALPQVFVAQGGRTSAVHGKIVLLHDSVVGNNRLLTLGGGRSLEQERPHDSVVPSDFGVLLDDLGVDVRNEEDGRKKRNTDTGTHGNGSDVPSGLFVKTELGRSLVDDGERANGAGNQEEERSSVDSPLD